jgi:3-oxoacyl-(acyl-carrier-protein) synthase/3-hydroxymyristoyl/3-hydroxydecanoyl-(acyl carrier protein) dehydratase
VFRPSGFLLDSSLVSALDPMTQWAMHCGREALADAGVSSSRERAGLVLGNLSFPTSSHAEFAEHVWLRSQQAGNAQEAKTLEALRAAALTGPFPDAHNRFSSGLVATLTARALGLGGEAFCLDAACASSLYALEMAARILHAGEADVMLAGAVNRADDLFIHVGFCALSAMSRTGQSRPFHRDADGLVPAEGAVLLALQRLDDAVAQNKKIYGVLRGVGLSNDGRGRGLLAPSEEGQQRAIRDAYKYAQISADEITLLECHATGTPVGDGTEVRSGAAVFEGCSQVPIGSLKSNLGHLVTVAGGAAILKVLSAMEHRVRPASLHTHTNELIDAIASSPFRVLQQNERWNGRRLAGVSAFGFGGNNAHAVLESFEDYQQSRARPSVAVRVPHMDARELPAIAVVAIGARVGQASSTEAVVATLMRGEAVAQPAQEVSVGLGGLRFPPKDLEHALPQQLWMLEIGREICSDLSLSRDRTGVYVGMGCDSEIARYGARWRMAQWALSAGITDAQWITQAQDAFVHPLQAAGVVGTMPNIPANRINSQLDLAGAGLSISSEEHSGLSALRTAVRALQQHALDAAVVGAVDFAHEPVLTHARASLGHTEALGDGAVAVVLMRESDARAQGRAVLAVVDPWATQSADASTTMGDQAGCELDPSVFFQHTHAAHGLLAVACAVWSLRYQARFALSHPARSDDALTSVRVAVGALKSTPLSVLVHRADTARYLAQKGASIVHSKQGILRREAHYSKVVLPAGTQNNRVKTNGIHTHTMERAPRLPSVTSRLEPLSSLPSKAPEPKPYLPQVIQAQDHVVTAAVQPAVTVLASVASASNADPRVESVYAVRTTGAQDSALAYAAKLHGQIASIHGQFVANQAAVHQAFLQLQQTLTHALVGYASDASAPNTVDAKELSTDLWVTQSVAEPAAVVQTPRSVPIVETISRTHDTATPVALPSVTPRVVTQTVLPGPKYSRKQLEVLAGGKISSIFGAEFAGQDGFVRQVRMPQPPLLLADRVTGIDAQPLTMGTGTLWTETDVRPDSWYLNDEGKIPAGIMIEAGQADLLLISWLGVDMLNRSERVYRLLGCEGSWHGPLPKAGDTLVYDIHVDSHANQGDVRLFFFHYDCRVNGELRLRVRGGQAGFFTDEELANSGGVLWNAEDEKLSADLRLDPPALECTKRALTRDELLAFARGKPFAAFGQGWEVTQAHVHSPRVSPEKLLLAHRVTELDVRGGPWKRGYLRAEQDVRADDWFFDGHFKNDPCMPGTIMFEGCLQMMAVYLAALGFTVDRDGWEFEPVQNTPYLMRCRGQVTPSSKQVVYEIFVKEVHSGPEPTVFADLLCSVDGRKAFHARRVGLKLVPSWPLEHWKDRLEHQELRTGDLVPLASLGGLKNYRERTPAAEVDGFKFDYQSLLACAWGRPSSAFGPFYQRFDSPRRVARLPGPPYHFMSRITKLNAKMGAMEAGGEIEVEYDVADELWYFEQNGFATMPFCVLMEAALQPCGWLASYVGSACSVDIDVLFRNLDGTGTLHADILPGSGPLVTKVKIDSISQTAGMIIESFTVQCSQGDRRVYEMKTVFGFFPKEAFENQVGLPVSDADRARFESPSNITRVLKNHTRSPVTTTAELADNMLLMLDRVVRWEPDGGKKSLGYARAEKDVDPNEWFFKAHFFQDPVQPGSLGIEAFCQLLQWAMLERGMAEGVANARFEPVMLGKPTTWKYRGQVVPKNKRIGIEVEIIEVGTDERGNYAISECSLWVDNKRIYSAKNLGMRIVSEPNPPPKRSPRRSQQDKTSTGTGTEHDVELVSLETHTWLGDHRPTWAIAAMPLFSMVDRLADRVQRDTGRDAIELRGVQVQRWLPIAEAATVKLKTESRGDGDTRECSLLAWRDANDPLLSRFELVASGSVRTGNYPPNRPAPCSALEDRELYEQPYDSGALFHGPAFRALHSLRMGHAGASATLSFERCTVPRGALSQGILDVLTHAIPHDDFHRWCAKVSEDWVGYPYRLEHLTLYERVPEHGSGRIEARFVSADIERRMITTDLQLIADERVIATAQLTEILLPKGPYGAATREARIRFLRDRQWEPSVCVSRESNGVTTLDPQAVQQIDWLPGNLGHIYQVAQAQRGQLAEIIAAKEHLARRMFCHPSQIDFDLSRQTGVARMRPVRAERVEITRDGALITVRTPEPTPLASPSTLDLTPVREYWSRWFALGHWPGEDLHYALIERFVENVVLTDPVQFAALRGRSCLYLANHQVGVESLLFSVLAAGLSAQPVVTLAKAEHRTSWLGKMIEHTFSYPNVRDPRLIMFFEREDREALLSIVAQLAEELRSQTRSVMVHVEGTRGVSCRHPVQKMSSAFVDMAIGVGVPIVPVRFVGGLPSDPPLETRLEFPLGYAKQEYWIGRAMMPDELQALPYKARKQVIMDAINSLGPSPAHEEPSRGDNGFAHAVASWEQRSGATAEHAAILMALVEYGERRTPEMQQLLEYAQRPVQSDDSAQTRWLCELARRLAPTM